MAIAFVAATQASNIISAVTSFTLTYAATSGNVVCCSLVLPGLGTAPSVKDNGGHTLTVGPTASANSANLQDSFYYTAGAGVTNYTVAWTTAQKYGFCLAEYSGVTGGVNGGLAGNSAIGTGTALSITVTTQDNNDWVVAGFGSQGLLTVTQGTSRVNTTAAADRSDIADNTAASAGAVTVGGTIPVSNLWTAIALELRLSSAIAAAANYNQLMMVGCGT